MLDSTTTSLNSLMSKPALTLISNNNPDSTWYQDKVEGSRRKLAAGYERENFIKQQHTICILQPHQIICAKQQQQQQKKKKNLIATTYHNKPARRTSLLAKWRAEEKVFRKLQRIADRPQSSSKANTKTVLQTDTVVQRRRELILRNILGHTPTISARPAEPASYSPGNSSSDDLQLMNSGRNDAGQTTSAVQELQKSSDSPVADLKGYSPPQIIRKSMFKFVIKLGRSGAGA